MSDARITGWEASFFDETYWAVNLAKSDAESDDYAGRMLAAMTVGDPEGLTGFDQGCGGGEIARAMARRGARMKAFDLSPDMVDIARRAGTADAVVADAVDPVPGAAGGYDFGYNAYSGIGYVDLETALRFLESATDALKPGAPFAVETMSAARVARQFEEVMAYERRHALTGATWSVERLCSLDRKTESDLGPIAMTQRWTMREQGGERIVERTSKVLLIRAWTLAALARIAGFEDVAILDAHTLEKPTQDTPRLILTMRRKRTLERSTLAMRVRQALRANGGEAIIDDGSLTGAEALDAIVRTAVAIESVANDDAPVAVMTGRNWGCAIGIAAARLTGRAFAVIDPKGAGDRLTRILGRLRPGIVITMNSGSEDARRIHRRNLLNRTGWLNCAAPGMREALNMSAYEGGRSLPEGVSHVCFTSGSTGEPKGVLLQEEGLLATVDAQIALMEGQGDPSLWMLNPAFDASLSDILCAILSGSPLKVHRPDPTRIKALRTALAQSARCDIPPSLMGAVEPAETGLSSIVFGGERAAAKHVKLWSERMTALQAYGPTEASVCAMMAVGHPGWTEGELGRPIGASDVWLRTADGRIGRIEPTHPRATPESGERFNAVAIPGIGDGETGEILISGASLALGYLGDETLTHARFPVISGIRHHATGDVATFKGGKLIWLGRTDRQIKLHGRMVCPEEIEAALSRAFPWMASHCLMHDGRLKIAIGTDASHEAPALAAIRERLGAGMTPHEAIGIGVLPRNANGKVDAAAVAEHISQKSANGRSS